MQLQSQGNSWTPGGTAGHQGEQLDTEKQLGSWTAAGQNSWTLEYELRDTKEQGRSLKITSTILEK
jgi:hypothetical protein